MDQTKLQHLGLRHAGMNVLDIGLMSQFYMSVLGYKLELQVDDRTLFLTSGPDMISMRTVDERSSKSHSLDHIGICLGSDDDVDHWFAHMMEQGVKIGSQPKTHRDGTRSFYCFDPEGNVIQLFSHPKISA